MQTGKLGAFWKWKSLWKIRYRSVAFSCLRSCVGASKHKFSTLPLLEFSFACCVSRRKIRQFHLLSPFSYLILIFLPSKIFQCLILLLVLFLAQNWVNRRIVRVRWVIFAPVDLYWISIILNLKIIKFYG